MVLGGPNGVVWMDAQAHPEPNAAVSWSGNAAANDNSTAEEDDIAAASSLSTFKSMLETDWFVNPPLVSNRDLHTLQNHLEIRELGFCTNPADNGFLLPQPIDSSASCSPSQAFALDQSFLATKSCFSSLLSNNPFDNAFDFASETTFLGQFQPNLMGFTQNQVGSTEFSSNSDFQATRLLTLPENASALGGGFNNGAFEVFDGAGSKAEISKHLEDFPSIGAQPTLFQKRAMRQGSAGAEKLGNLEVAGLRFRGEVADRKRKRSEDGEIEEGSVTLSGLNYDSDELNEDSKVAESEKNGGRTSNGNSTVTGLDQKGKKKGMPAKNLMAERRRRKKLNDRLYMLRSVVPKISKMDRASILGDAIDYLKELLQRINDLHNELESTPPASLMPPSTNFLPSTLTPSTLPSRVKEELCSSSLPSPKNQTAKVEVRMREGRAVNIHMFCARRPGLLLSTMRALDNLGLEIQQAVISCFNGFALDVFQAEQCREGQDILPEQIKAMLLDSAGLHGMM